MNQRINKYLLWIITAAYALLIFYLSITPQSGLFTFSYMDKLLHFVAYAGLGFLCAWALRFSITASWRSIIFVAVCIATLYGIFNEIVQMYIPTRSTEFLDALANAAGALVGALFAMYISRRIRNVSLHQRQKACH
ncbi:MAG: VanZ family protein [Pseudomonadota bacterium]